MPWAVMGDFNVVRFLDEKVGGFPLTIHKLKDFNECISYCSLPDISCTGSIWSWSNRTTGQRRIVGRLDRILCNTSWIDKLPESVYAYLCSSSSDHAPMLLQIKPTTNSGPKPFRFYNYWKECEGFSDIL